MNMDLNENKKTWFSPTIKTNPQNIILKTLEQYWLVNSMYESIDAIHSPVL
jgi:hypothetical protein